MMNEYDAIKIQLESLVGQKAPFEPRDLGISLELFKEGGIGFNQFNELLLLFGFDVIKNFFFQYLVDGETEYNKKSVFESIDDLEKGVNRFRKFAAFRFGNIRYPFKVLSKEKVSLDNWLKTIKARGKEGFIHRQNQIIQPQDISEEELYYLSEKGQKELKEIHKQNEESPIKTEKEFQDLLNKGEFNYRSYLASDHLDVYVATSMRLGHEFISVNRLINKIFKSPKLKKLRLRWFDPTQSCCKNRYDKGLLECLMLKRAKCTLYLVQETDTFGKDSELASTLAQGKPVIAYVPHGDRDYVNELLNILNEVYDQKSEFDLIVEQLKIFEPSLPWKNKTFRELLNNPNKENSKKLKNVLFESIKNHYNDRAEMLETVHPLGLQVNLETGVANGVLVVRTVPSCIDLLYSVLTGEIDLSLETERNEKGDERILLRENISKCVFRVVTDDRMLTNTFWNYYPTK